MIIGATGPRDLLMPFHQHEALFAKLVTLDTQKGLTFIHGAAVGTDAIFHKSVCAWALDLRPDLRQRIRMEIFPSDLPQWVDHELKTVGIGIPIIIHRPSPPLERNIAMARTLHELWVFPKSKMRTRSGTWHMVGQVERLCKPVVYFWP